MKLTFPRARVAALLGSLLLALPIGVYPADGKARVDTDKVYFGDAKKYKRPAVVDVMKVYAKIPAHQEILDRKLTREHPDYWPLLRKASQSFVRALRRVCAEKGYDLVGEVNSISIEGRTVPEITADVIASLDKKDDKGEKGASARAPAPPGPTTASAEPRR